MSAPDRVDGLAVLDDGFHLSYTDEASVRTGLARLARGLGWGVVREEVVIPGWGRVDLLLHEVCELDWPYLIEIKLDLTRPSVIRRAFQQADGYRRWWRQEYSQHCHPILAAVKFDAVAVGRVATAYREVTPIGVGSLMAKLPNFGWRQRQRAACAKRRVQLLEAELGLHRAAQAVAARVGTASELEQARRDATEHAQRAAWVAAGVPGVTL